MQKKLKWGLIGLLVLLGLFLAGLEVLARMYREQAAAFFRQKFTKQSDLVLQPFQTTVSVWSHFPRITFNLDNLALVDTTGAKPVQVLGIKRVEIAVPLGQFNLEKIKISRVNLIDVLFHQRIDSLGNKIGLTFKPAQNPDTTGSELPFVIPKLDIRNAKIISENQYKQSSFIVTVSKARLRADLINQQLTVQGEVAGELGAITSKKMVLLRGEPFTGKVQYAYALNQKEGRIYNTKATVNGHQVSIAGTHTALPGGTGANLNLRITGNQPILYILTQLMPAQAKTFLSKVSTKSRMQFALHISGPSGPKIRPRNVISFNLQRGEFYLPASKTVIREVQLVGQMDNGTQRSPETSRLTISDFSAVTHEDSFRVALQLHNFVRPSFTFKGKGRLHLTELAAFVKLPFTSVAGGTVLGDVNLSGNIPDARHTVSPNWRGQGSVQVQNATFQPVGLKAVCRDVNGGVRFRDNLLEMQDLHGTVGGHPFKLQAAIRNFLAYLFDQPGAIQANAQVYAAHLNYDWLQTGRSSAAKTKRPKRSGTNHQTHDSFRQNSLQNIQSQVNLRVGSFDLPIGKRIRNLTVQVNQQNERITLTNMRFLSSGGGVAAADGGFRLTEAGIAAPYLNVRLNYPTLDFQEFMQNLEAIKQMKKPARTTAAAAKPKAKQKPSFLEEDDYRVSLQVKAAKIKYVHLKGTNLYLKADLNSHRVKIAKLDLASSGGEIHMRGEMQLDAPNNTYPVKLRSELHNLDLRELFAMAENMQLDVLSSRNIKGSIVCNLTVFTSLDKTFTPSLDRTIAYAKATFRKMELIEVVPIQNALRLLRKERTRHLYFDDVTTNFLLSNNQFLTPGLRLNSNLTAFNLSGTYTMGGGANLHMDVGVMNILLGNNKRRIEKIQAQDSTKGPNYANKQHLQILRVANKYKVRLSNRKQREENILALRQEYHSIIRQHQIDTTFVMHGQ